MGLIKQGVNNNLAASQRKTTKTAIINTEHLGLNTLFLYKSTISGQLICYKAFSTFPPSVCVSFKGGPVKDSKPLKCFKIE